MKTLKTKEEGLQFVREALERAQVANEVKGKVIAVFTASSSPWWFSPTDYIEYLVSQLITLFTYKFEDERMSIPANMVYLMSAEKGVPSILLHWRVYLSLYAPYVRGWRLETIKDGEGRPIGMTAVIIDKEGNEWRWERYYENLQLTSRWKNKELMFAKTILKEALAIMFPQLNLLPPLSTVETYDPDDIDNGNGHQVASVAHIMNVSVKPNSYEAPNVQDVKAEASDFDTPENNNYSYPDMKRSPELVRRMTNIPPAETRQDKKGEASINREVQDKFRELSDLVGHEEALKIAKGIVRDLGANEFKELSPSKQQLAFIMLSNAIELERKLRGYYDEQPE
jgi:hypothetical protein